MYILLIYLFFLLEIHGSVYSHIHPYVCNVRSFYELY